MKTYTEAQLIDWVFKQPDNRPVYMACGNNKANKVGCVMIQFLRSKRIKFDVVYMDGDIARDGEIIGNIDLGDRCIFKVFVYENDHPFCKNFGDLKRFYTPKKD